MAPTMFKDREEAGRGLARALAGERLERPLILGIPRGGVVVAAGVARALGAELDVIVPRKMGAPGEPELAIGAVMQDGTLFLDEHASALGGTKTYVEEEKRRQQAEIERRVRLFRGDRPYPELAGRVAVVVDDGAATGATAVVALRWLRKKGVSKSVIALPVAPADTLTKLGVEADGVLCLRSPVSFHAVGQFYENFDQVEDGEVASLLREAWRRQNS